MLPNQLSPSPADARRSLNTVKLTLEALTDVGVERAENQDACGSTRVGNLDFFYVCDGMGGHRGGSTASTLAVEVLTEALSRAEGTVEARMQSAIEAANLAIFELAKKRRDLNGMGTTLVMVAIDHDAGTAHVAHVGDSRAYRLHGDLYQRITKDHTWVQRLVDDGVLTPEGAENHPHSNVIARSLGGRPDVEIEFTDVHEAPAEGDVFLLCSDGLYGLVKEPEVVRMLADLEPPAAARALVDRANALGGHDNVTVQLVYVGERAEALETYRFAHPPNGYGHKTGRNTVPASRTGVQTAVSAELAETPEPAHAHSHNRELFVEPPPENEERGSGALIVVLAAAIGVVLILLAVFGTGGVAVQPDEGSAEPAAGSLEAPNDPAN